MFQPHSASCFSKRNLQPLVLQDGGQPSDPSSHRAVPFFLPCIPASGSMLQTPQSRELCKAGLHHSCTAQHTQVSSELASIHMHGSTRCTRVPGFGCAGNGRVQMFCTSSFSLLSLLQCLQLISSDFLPCHAINSFTEQLKIKLPVFDKLWNKPLSCGDKDKLQLLNTRIQHSKRRK